MSHCKKNHNCNFTSKFFSLYYKLYCIVNCNLQLQLWPFTIVNFYNCKQDNSHWVTLLSPLFIRWITFYHYTLYLSLSRSTMKHCPIVSLFLIPLETIIHSSYKSEQWTETNDCVKLASIFRVFSFRANATNANSTNSGCKHLHSATSLSITKFRTDFGKPIPFADFDCHSLEALVRLHFSNRVRIQQENGMTIYKLIPNEKNAHIVEMVAKTKLKSKPNQNNHTVLTADDQTKAPIEYFEVSNSIKLCQSFIWF